MGYNPKWFTKPRMGAQLNKAHPINRGLEAYWIANEGGGTVLRDITGNGNNGTLTNFALSGVTSNWAGSPMGGGLNFDGSNDHVLDNTLLPNMTSATYIAFFQTGSTLGSGEPYKGVVVRYTSASAKFGFFVQTGGYIYAYVGAGAQLAVASLSGTIAVNEYYQVALSYDSVGGLRLYINGAFNGGTAANGNLATNTPVLQIGRASDVAARYFTGTIDEVRIYSRALHPDEIQTLYVNPHIDFIDSNRLWINPTLYGLGAWGGKLIGSGATGTLTANSENNTVEAGMAIALKKQ